MPSGSAQRLVRIAVSVMLPYHRSLLGSCPLAGGLCPRAHMISRRRLQTPRAAADGTERPAALRYASARWYSARGARPGRLCAPAAARSGLLGSILVHSGTCFQGKATMRVSDAASTASCQHGPHTSACILCSQCHQVLHSGSCASPCLSCCHITGRCWALAPLLEDCALGHT